jgi:hypothetical protein
MTVSNMRQSVADLDDAIAWVGTLIPDLKKSWRYFHYRDLLQELIDDANDPTYLTINMAELSYVLEAFNSTQTLLAIHRKLKSRTDPPFRIKLREATYGPLFPSQETKDLHNKSWGSHGRNTEAELVIAALVKDPDAITFNSADFAITTPSYKIGVEVKRLQSPTSIVRLYLAGAKQIQENPDIQWGVVMLRFDRLLYSNKKGPILLTKPMLERKRYVGLRVKESEEMIPHLRFQVESLQRDFAHLFLAETRNFNLKKVLGYGVYVNMPFAIGQPPNIHNEGLVKMTFWGAREGDIERLKARKEFMESQEYRDCITIEPTSQVILL